MLELNLHTTPADKPSMYLDPHVVAADELITTTSGEDESEPPPALPIAPTETSIDILQPSQVIYHPRPTRTLRLPTTQLMLQLRSSKNQNWCSGAWTGRQPVRPSRTRAHGPLQPYHGAPRRTGSSKLISSLLKCKILLPTTRDSAITK